MAWTTKTNIVLERLLYYTKINLKKMKKYISEFEFLLLLVILDNGDLRALAAKIRWILRKYEYKSKTN